MLAGQEGRLVGTELRAPIGADWDQEATGRAVMSASRLRADKLRALCGAMVSVCVLADEVETYGFIQPARRRC